MHLIHSWNNVSDDKHYVKTWAWIIVINLIYLYVEARLDNRCPNVFIAQFNWKLIGHVLKMV